MSLSIEKHFTADNNQIGPDHAFSMNPQTWKEMVDRARELENALGNGIKTIEANENETVILQRRSVRVKQDIQAGTIINLDMLEELRPAPINAVLPYQKQDIIGKKLIVNKEKGDFLKYSDVEL